MDWKKSLKSKIKKGFEEAAVSGLDHVGTLMEKSPESLSSIQGVARGALSEGVKAAGRKVTKDQIIVAIGNCGKSGAAGAAIDGFLGVHAAQKLYAEGIIDKKIFTDHVTREIGCGFISSLSGTAGTILVATIAGTTGPAALLGGMGASVGSRYIYRNLVEGVLPTAQDTLHEETESDLEDILFEIERAKEN